MDTIPRDAATWAAGYVDYLRDALGAADTTRARHLPIVRRFITACAGPDAPDWTGLSVQQVTEFIRGEAAQRTLRANDDETSSPRKFSLEGAEGSSCSCP